VPGVFRQAQDDRKVRTGVSKEREEAMNKKVSVVLGAVALLSMATSSGIST